MLPAVVGGLLLPAVVIVLLELRVELDMLLPAVIIIVRVLPAVPVRLLEAVESAPLPLKLLCPLKVLVFVILLLLLLRLMLSRDCMLVVDAVVAREDDEEY